MTPDISVLIPHYGPPDELRRCLRSLDAQTFDAARFEIVVADNGPAGALTPLGAEFPHVRFVPVAERGAAHARNAAMAAASGGAFAFIDSDCLAAPTWLEAGLDALRDAHLAGGAIQVFPRDPARPSAVEAFEMAFAFRQRFYVERRGFAATANLFARRTAAEAIGPFTHGVAEDLDWCRRGTALGFRLRFNPNPVVAHPARADWPALTAKWDRLIRERRAAFGPEGDAVAAVRWGGLAAATAASAGPHMAGLVFSKRLSGLRAKAGAAAVLARLRLWRAMRMLSAPVNSPPGAAWRRRGAMTSMTPSAGKSRVQGFALVATLIAGLCASVGAARAEPPAQTVARVAGEEVTVAELRLELTRWGLPPGDPATEQAALTALIERKALAAAAREAKLNRSPEGLARIAAAEDAALAELYLSLAAAPPPPTPLEIDVYIAEHPALFAERRVYDFEILTLPSSEFDAERIVPLVDGDADFTRLRADLDAAGAPYRLTPAVLPAEAFPEPVRRQLAAYAPGDNVVIEGAVETEIYKIVRIRPAPSPHEERIAAARRLIAEARAAERRAAAIAGALERAEVEILRASDPPGAGG